MAFPLGGIQLGSFMLWVAAAKARLEPAFCFLNMDLIPSLMIYDKGDQCRLQVRALGLFVCVSVCVYFKVLVGAQLFVHCLYWEHDVTDHLKWTASGYLTLQEQMGYLV